MEYMQVNRANGRAADELRPIKLTRGVMKHAHGSCLAEFGDTRVLCAATIEEGVPGWRKGAKAGWVTAEYAMLPASTGKRCKREHANRKGRSMEIERLIGRSLRTVVNMKALGEYTVTVDCDVIQADGGTRTASITGAGWRCTMPLPCGSRRVSSSAFRSRARSPRFPWALSTATPCSTWIIPRTVTPRST